MKQPHASLRAALHASRGIFFAYGCVIGTWSVFIPIVRDGLQISVGMLGLALLLMSLGAMLAMPFVGGLCSRFGSATVLRVVAPLVAASLLLPVLAPGIWTFALALLYFGALNGATDVSMNAQGIFVENRLGRPVMSGTHAAFSLGALAGAACAGLVLHVLSPTLAIFVLTFGILALSAACLPFMIFGDAAPLPADRPRRSWSFRIPERPVIALGLLAFLALMSEGAMIDWSAALLRDEFGASSASAAAGFVVFSAAMALGRLTGDWMVARYNRRRVFQTSALVAGLGFGAGLAIGGLPAVLAGIACLGLGLANLVPILFSAAVSGNTADAGPAVSIVATLGYTGLLAGPPLIGFIAQLTDLRIGISLLALIALVMFVSSPQVRRIRTATADDCTT
jgi:MFS family permease